MQPESLVQMIGNVRHLADFGSASERCAPVKSKWVIVAISIFFLGVLSVALGADGFVTRRGTDFSLDGRNLRFSGTNNYYLHYSSHAEIDDVLYRAMANVRSTFQFAGQVP